MISKKIVIFIALLLLAPLIYAEQTKIKRYKFAKNIFWSEIYRSGMTLYCNEKFNRSRRTEQGNRVNIEHVVPAKSMTLLYQCGGRKKCRRKSASFNLMEADLHNMYPSILSVNSDRGSFDFGTVDGDNNFYQNRKNRDGSSVSYANCKFGLKNRIVEPQDRSKGNIARIYFYMMQEYGLQLDGDFKILLQQWNRSDLPLPEELERNDLIERLQGTRNRFIDDPVLADKL